MGRHRSPIAPRLLFVATAVILAVASGQIIQAAEQAPAAVNAPVDADHAMKMREGLELYRTQVRGLLVKNCVRCHGGKDTESEFDITTRERFVKGGAEGKAKTVIPGNAKGSRLTRLIRHDEDPGMPEEAAKLKDDEIASISRWIDLGAPYDGPLVDKAVAAAPWPETVVPVEARKFWAFEPLKQAAPPQVRNAAWVRTPVDRFVLTKLEAKGIAPNGPAERRVLIRRAYFDLIGLPPSPTEIEVFVNDKTPDAYEKVLDHLLASPHYGERWARHWLDVARFAESFGFEHDTDRKHAYPYRDFVIRALNDNMPYDQFIRWQLAGDELAPDNPLAMSATGFLGAGVFPTQITANEVERTRYDALDDMASTTSVAVLGMSVGCARCHDHKFDPIPQADYYRFLSTFTTAVRSEVSLPQVGSADPQAEAEYAAQHKKAQAALSRLESDKLPQRFDAWLAQQNRGGKPLADDEWTTLEIAEARSQGGATLTPQPDGSLLAGGNNPGHEEYTLVARTDIKGITALRVEALANSGLPHGGPGRAPNGNFCLTDLKVEVAPAGAPEKRRPLKLVRPRATFEQKGLPVAAVIDGHLGSGWAVDFGGIGHDQMAAFDFEEPLSAADGVVLTCRLKFENNVQHAIGQVRLSVSTQASAPVQVAANASVEKKLLNAIKAAGGAGKLSPAKKQALLGLYRKLDPEWLALSAELTKLESARPQPKQMTVMVVSEGVKPLRLYTQGADFFDKTYFLNRGDTNQKNGEAKQGFLQVLVRAKDGVQHWIKPPSTGAKTSQRRTALANWLMDTQDGAGHLAARVEVNRLWQHHFGRGIVSTPNDFGKQGSPPSNPELLDYLAAQLISGGWQLKPLHKLMMTSAVYMESSQSDAQRKQLDPENELLWRRGAARLDSEVIRDNLLAVSGVLDPTMFGPGTLNQASKRRSIYFMVKRSEMIPMMQTFDAPEALGSQALRTTTTVAPQALLLINSPQVRGAAGEFAKRLDAAPGASLAAQVRDGYLAAVGRVPSDVEQKDCVEFIESQTKSYQTAGKPDARRMALTDFCQALFALNEFVYVE